MCERVCTEVIINTFINIYFVALVGLLGSIDCCCSVIVVRGIVIVFSDSVFDHFRLYPASTDGRTLNDFYLFSFLSMMMMMKMSNGS